MGNILTLTPALMLTSVELDQAIDKAFSRAVKKMDREVKSLERKQLEEDYAAMMVRFRNDAEGAGAIGAAVARWWGLDESVLAMIRRLPLERLLVETDSPYLTPVPHRGKENQPAYVRDVVAFVASLKGISPETLAAQTSANFRQLFGAG